MPSAFPRARAGAALIAVVLLVALVPLAAGSMRPKPGSLDRSFGVRGKVMTSIGQGATAYAMTRTRHGKIVVAGTADTVNGPEFALARYTRTGHLDRSFGKRGIVTTRIGQDGRALGLAAQKDGRILIAGWSGTASDYAATLVRYRPSGALDRSFGEDGTVRLNLTGHDRLRAVVLEPGGRILVAGSSNWRFLLARYTSRGALDASFGRGGIVLGGTHSYEQLDALAIAPSGKIVAAGDFGFEIYPMDVLRYTPNGILDRTFGKGGEVVAKIAGWGTLPVGIRVQKRGKIVVAAASAGDEVTGGPFWRFGLTRFHADGSLDTSFGATRPGIERTGIGSAAYAQAFTADRKGRLLVSGWATKSGKDDFALAGYTANGHLDHHFGHHGKVVTALTGGNDRGAAMLLQRGGRIVVGGTAGQGFLDSRFALAGYRGH
jgi:uncharacterized delta-60 repeat protein